MANYFVPNRIDLVICVTKCLASRWLDFVDLHGSMSSRVYPEKRVSPLIREFDLDNMITLGASRSISLENRIRARAAAVHTLQD